MKQVYWRVYIVIGMTVCGIFLISVLIGLIYTVGIRTALVRALIISGAWTLMLVMLFQAVRRLFILDTVLEKDENDVLDDDVEEEQREEQVQVQKEKEQDELYEEEIEGVGDIDSLVPDRGKWLGGEVKNKDFNIAQNEETVYSTSKKYQADSENKGRADVLENVHTQAEYTARDPKVIAQAIKKVLSTDKDSSHREVNSG